MDKKKVCKIINRRFNIFLEVDGHEIPFRGSYNAEYFQNHYANLGYEIILEKEKDDEQILTWP